MANKALVAKIFGDVIFGEANFSLTYASSIFDHLVFSFASFSVAVVGKQSEYYQNYPFVVGILASTSGDIIKLSYDLLSAATHTCHDFIMGKDYFSVTEEL